ncbi:hypothetical protein RQN9TF_04460 [Rhodococcus qingshengii]|nr:hypothetical protein RQN9TF_04460 [Rhodococcus qingshengii]
MESQFMVAKLAGRGPLYASKASKAVLLLGGVALELVRTGTDDQRSGLGLVPVAVEDVLGHDLGDRETLCGSAERVVEVQGHRLVVDLGDGLQPGGEEGADQYVLLWIEDAIEGEDDVVRGDRSAVVPGCSLADFHGPARGSGVGRDGLCERRIRLTGAWIVFEQSLVDVVDRCHEETGCSLHRVEALVVAVSDGGGQIAGARGTADNRGR